MEFFNVTIATDDHNDDSVSVLQLKAKILESIRIRMLKKNNTESSVKTKISVLINKSKLR